MINLLKLNKIPKRILKINKILNKMFNKIKSFYEARQNKMFNPMICKMSWRQN